jgi:hypothetical protein
VEVMAGAHGTLQMVSGTELVYQMQTIFISQRRVDQEKKKQSQQMDVV